MKSTCSFIIVFLILFSFLSTAQPLPVQWIREHTPQGKSADRIDKIIADSAGNVYVAGYAGASRGYPDAFAMKRNSSGDTLWTYYYNGPGMFEDYFYDMLVDDTGNVYLTGQSTALAVGWHECITVKLDNNGVQKWLNRYSPTGSGDSQGNSIALDDSGNVYVAGYFDPPANSQQWLVIKYNSQGIQQWVDQVDLVPGDDEAMQIIIAPNGNATVSGKSFLDMYVKQYTPGGGNAGSFTWTNLSASGFDTPYGLKFIPNGNLIVAGIATAGPGSQSDPFAVSYSFTSSSVQWEYIYTDATTAPDEFAYAVAMDDTGNCYIAGSDWNNNLITKINGDGSKGWRRSWNGPATNSKDVLFDIKLDNNGGVYASGKGIYPGPDYFGNGGIDNMIVLKYNVNGDSLWTRRISDTNDISIGWTMDIKNGKIYVSGFKADTADIDQDHYVWIMDTTGTTIHEWIYNGKGEGLAKGQIVRTDASDNIYVAATCDRQAGYQLGYDIVILKYNAIGDLQWEKFYSSHKFRNDTLTAFDIDAAGNLILSVSSDTNGLGNGYQLYLVKMNGTGQFLDTLFISGPTAANSIAHDMHIRNDGSIILGGVAGGLGGFVTFIDDQFTQQWIAQLDSTPNTISSVNAVDEFSNGDIAIGGTTYDQPLTIAKGLVQRFDINGNRLWTIDVDSAGIYDNIRDVNVSNNDNVAITGSSGTTTMTEMHNGIDGQLIWRSIYNPNTPNEYGMKVINSNQGNTVVLNRGYTGFVARFTTVQYNGTTGAQQWATSYSPVTSTREPVDMLVEPSGRVVAAGWEINGSTVDVNCSLVGYTTTGVQNFVNTYTSAGSHPENWNSLCRDQQGNFILTGGSSADFLNEYLYHILTIKYGGSAVGVEEISKNNDAMIVYPNPTSTGNFRIVEINSSSPVINYEIYNLTGQCILQGNDIEKEIDLSVYPTGTFLLKYQRENGQYGTVKIVRNY